MATRSPRPERFIVAIMLSIWLIALIEFVFIAAPACLGELASPRRGASRRDRLHANDLGRCSVGYAILLFVWWEAKSLA
jgi:hypothetical protein